MNLFQMKQELRELGANLQSISQEIRSKASNKDIGIEELRTLKTQQENTEERFNLLKREIEKYENENKEGNTDLIMKNDEQRMIKAKAELIRSSILGNAISNESRNILGANQTTSTGGEKFLPVNMANKLISEPLTRNPLRKIIVTSNIKGLELPKIAYQLDDDDFISDEETAKEINLQGDKVTFGRHKFKIKARISDTVIHGSDADLINFVENALRSGLAAKEKKCSLTQKPKTGEEHMTFYSTQNGIKKVSGETLYKATKSAIADLHEDYRENAKILMRYSDYMDIIEDLANGNASLYSAQPEQILGKPVEFCDNAINPIVGDFNYAHMNYDGDITYDTDKDIDKGEYLFVLTAWVDIQLKLKSAFRIVETI